MKIHLPKDLEESIHAEVMSGHFVSADDAIAEAIRLLLRQQPAQKPPNEDEFKRQLVQAGLMTSLPTPIDPAMRRDFPPVRIEGEPLSETIIRERR